METIAQISSRGQVTLPADVRKQLGLKPGATVMVHLEEGRIILEPVVVLPVEIYTEGRIAEFTEQASMTSKELEQARLHWQS